MTRNEVTMRILCATDLLTKSDAAIERAGMLADQLDAGLTLLHVVVPGESQQALELALDAPILPGDVIVVSQRFF